MMKVKNQKSKIKNWEGMSLLEILIVVTLFAFLGLIVTGSIILSLQGSKKSEAQTKVSENLGYTMSIIERQIRNANSVPDCATNTDNHILNYTDQNGDATSFSCINMSGADPYVASGSGRLTPDDVLVTACNFTCAPGTAANPPTVSVFLEMQSAAGTGSQTTAISSSTQIQLRSY
ncbi:MAG: type II secretion system protein [Candidatus Woesebacteria bacterium]|nr:MAG: type II secretion system protein [Candidatus Woesebacteria bacterium]